MPDWRNYIEQCYGLAEPGWRLVLPGRAKAVRIKARPCALMWRWLGDLMRWRSSFGVSLRSSLLRIRLPLPKIPVTARKHVASVGHP
jgi:hypothetical protein